MSELVNDLLKKAEQLKTDRSNFETEWQDCADIFLPIRSDIIVSRTKGDKSDYRRLFESFPILAVETLASILDGTLTNRSSKWFSLSSLKEEINEDKAASSWFSDATDIMFATMYDPKSNFEKSLLEGYRDGITFGTMATQAELGKNAVLNYITKSIKSYYIAENDQGQVDYVILKFKLTARQAMQKWPDNLHKNIIEASEKSPFKEFEFQQHIFPRRKRDLNKVDVLNKKLASYYIDETHKVIVEETGFDVMPIATGRTEKATDEVYGTSRCMIALADARQLNSMSRQLSEATELAIKPPLNINATFPKRLNLSPGALNFAEQIQLATGRSTVEQLLTIGNIPLTIDHIIRKEEKIREIFFLDKLKIIDNPNATATQVLELRAQSFRIMSSLASSIQSEYLENILNITFDLLFQKSFDPDTFEPLPGGVLPPLPDILKQPQKLRIIFNNPISQAQQATQLNAIDVLVSSVAEMAQIDPNVLDVINFDEVARKKRQVLNVDPDLMHSEEEVQEMREKRAEQAQEEQEAQQAQQAVDTAAQARNAQFI